MRLALLFNNNDYLANDNVPILAVEVVDPTLTADSDITFTDTVNNIEYIKKYLNIPDDSYKNTIISNYSDCIYKKSTNVIVCQYTNPTNRAITSLNTKYPMLTDQYLIPFV